MIYLIVIWIMLLLSAAIWEWSPVAIAVTAIAIFGYSLSHHGWAVFTAMPWIATGLLIWFGYGAWWSWVRWGWFVSDHLAAWAASDKIDYRYWEPSNGSAVKMTLEEVTPNWRNEKYRITNWICGSVLDTVAWLIGDGLRHLINQIYAAMGEWYQHRTDSIKAKYQNK